MTARREPRVVTEGFHQRVFAVVRLVPAGAVTTYGDVAAALGARSVARHVGYALAALGRHGASDDVPWHRVLNVKGAPVGDTSQRALLEAEGVAFDGRGRVDLRRYGHRFERELLWEALRAAE
ncbi:MAG: MGMT family protein [Myxococcota bacterium]